MWESFGFVDDKKIRLFADFAFTHTEVVGSLWPSKKALWVCYYVGMILCEEEIVDSLLHSLFPGVQNTFVCRLF